MVHHGTSLSRVLSAWLLVTMTSKVQIAAMSPKADIDIAQIRHLKPIPQPDVPVVYQSDFSSPTTTQIVPYNSEFAAAVISDAVVATWESFFKFPIMISPAKELIPRSDDHSKGPRKCTPQPAGSGPSPDTDDADNFKTFNAFSAAASTAPSPAGYVRSFANLRASNNAYGYLGYTLLDSYDTHTCGRRCSAVVGCQAFNIYFERNPTVDPNDLSCLDPPSTTNIKCVFWGGPVTKSNAVNMGQTRGKFQVVVAGSNGYINRSMATPDGYSEPHFLKNKCIRAPSSCQAQQPHFLQSNTFVVPSFDINLCATACSEQKAWAHARSMHECSFFDTYILYKNSAPVAQYCAMYDTVWNDTYAENSGYYDRRDHYTIDFSFSSYNATSNVEGQPCNV